jgi:hypothetical protein
MKILLVGLVWVVLDQQMSSIILSIVGSEDYSNYQEFSDFLDLYLRKSDSTVTKILTLGHNGVDSLAKDWTSERNIDYSEESSDLSEMVSHCDLMICVWDGKSRKTIDATIEAHSQQKPVVVFRSGTLSVWEDKI